MSDPIHEPQLFQESLTGAAIDGVRIGCLTARTLVELDERLSDDQVGDIVTAIDAARMYLDAARAAVRQVNPSSVHVVARPSGIIVPP